MGKYTIRKGVWETNSSSVHSLIVSKDGLRQSQLKVDKDGYIHIPLGRFGRDYHVYTSQEDKLSYLLTCVAYMAGCVYGNDDYEKYYSNYYFEEVEEAILDYLPEHTAKGIKVSNLSHAELDHQSIPAYGEFPIDVNIWNPRSIQNFVFNDYIMLETESD